MANSHLPAERLATRSSGLSAFTPSAGGATFVEARELLAVTGRENYRLHSQIVFPVSTYDRGEGHIAKMKHFERPSGGLRVYLPKASAPKLHQ